MFPREAVFLISMHLLARCAVRFSLFLPLCRSDSVSSRHVSEDSWISAGDNGVVHHDIGTTVNLSPGIPSFLFSNRKITAHLYALCYDTSLFRRQAGMLCFWHFRLVSSFMFLLADTGTCIPKIP